MLIKVFEKTKNNEPKFLHCVKSRKMAVVAEGEVIKPLVQKEKATEDKGAA